MPQSSHIKSEATVGWDVGGAHLKAALLSETGEVLQVCQVACQLWRGMAELEQALAEVLSQLESVPERHAVTMTGELVDIFPNRRAGVLQIAQFMAEHLNGEVLFYSAKQGFVDGSQVPMLADSIASANWHASASLIAKSITQAVLIDIGSTTSDLILIKDGLAASQGFTDAERMHFDELIYAGVVRTPLMAMCQKVQFDGFLMNVAAEHFATTADVYRLTGEMSLQDDMADTSDGAGKTELESARRLARMIGHDVEHKDISAWKALAFEFRKVQITRLQEALSHLDINQDVPLVGAGAGRFLVRVLAEEMSKPYLDVETLMNASNKASHWASVCLPAVAVASLSIGKQC
jgi:(4-(4-[2-(gamma-L-glutamylamino)ethyl]phenoxymethyl)furan-2-yl)methanamine synthase